MAVGKRSGGKALQKVLGQGGNINADNPLEVHDPKVGSLISYEGVATADGAADGSTLIDNDLTTKPDFNGNLVIITSGAYAGQGRDINGVTTAGTVTPNLAFGGQILRGTTFVIVALRLTPAEVAALTALVTALMADVGDASTAVLGNLFGILGDPAAGEDLATRIGYEGALSIANKLTAARATLLDQITALRMAELDPAGLPADVAAVAAQLVVVLADTTALLLDTAAIIASLAALNDLAQADILSDATPFAGADIAAIVAALAAIPTENYFEQNLPILMNSTQSLTNAAGNKDFIGDNVTGAKGLISTDDTKVQKVMLVIIGRAVSSYDGDNALDCTTATHNQWKINLDGGAWSDLVNEEADGQMLDDDWQALSRGAIHPFTFMFDVTSQITNIDGKIGLRLENGRAEQDSFIVTCDIFLKVLWKL